IASSSSRRSAATWPPARRYGSSHSTSSEETDIAPHGIDTGLIERIAPLVEDIATSHARALPAVAYPDIRVDVSEGKCAASAKDSAKASGDGYGFSFGVRVLAGGRMIAPGYFGQGLGAADLPRLDRLLKDGLLAAYRRALANAELKAEIKGKFGAL